MKIVNARPEDADALTNIAITAKSHLGYPASWMQRWKNQLTITPEYISAHPTFVATLDGKFVGFHTLTIESNEALLDHLWVLPQAMGRGIGRALFAHAEDVARRSGARRMKIVGDPHAEGFYHRMGATVYARQPATMDGKERHLPLLEKAL